MTLEELQLEVKKIYELIRRHVHDGIETEELTGLSSTVSDVTITTSDITTNNVSSAKHGFAPKSPGDATKFLNGDNTPDYKQVKDSDLSISDVTTNNASTSNHGFLKKLPNDSTLFMDGTGSWTAPPTSPTLFEGVVDVLVVGGGGQGGYSNPPTTWGGGGEGGEVVETIGFDVISHIGVDQAYTVTVGTGGNAIWSATPEDGDSSSFHSITAQGGHHGQNGPSGAGGTGGPGADGGAGNDSGAATAGNNGTASSLSGASVTYGGGGGGGSGTGTGAAGGTGGGGHGGDNAGNFITSGTDGLGGGGGGTVGNPGVGNNDGGNGVVIVRYVTANFGPCTGGTITTDGSDTIHTFTSSGTFTVVAK